MNQTGDRILAGSGLSQNEHWNIGLRQQFRLGTKLLHRRAGTDEECALAKRFDILADEVPARRFLPIVLSRRGAAGLLIRSVARQTAESESLRRQGGLLLFPRQHRPDSKAPQSLKRGGDGATTARGADYRRRREEYPAIGVGE